MTATRLLFYFRTGVFMLCNDKQLWELLSHDIETRTRALVVWIKQQYRDLLH